MKTDEFQSDQVWQEEPPFTDGWAFHTTDARVLVVVRRYADPHQGYEIYFRRWEGDGLPPPLPGIAAAAESQTLEHRPSPEGRFPTLESALEKARALAAQPLPDFAQGFIAQAAPEPPRQVAKVDHPSLAVKALILEHSDGRFEWRSFRYEPVGMLQDGTPCEWDWARQHRDRLNLTTTLDSAIAAAQRELEALCRTQISETR